MGHLITARGASQTETCTETPWDLVEMQSDSQGWGGAWDPAFLTGAMLLVWGAVRPPLHGAINTGQDDVHG